MSNYLDNIDKDVKEHILKDDVGYIYENWYYVNIGGRKYKLETLLHINKKYEENS